MKRLALIHTVTFLADFFKQKLAERFPDLSSFHVVDESLLQSLAAAGGLTPGIVRRIATQAMLARDAGAELILFTCSATSPAADTARKLVEIPILKIDDPMAEKAVTLGPRVGVVCTTQSTMDVAPALIRDHAARMGREVVVTAHLEAPAFQAVMAGDKARHDALVSAAARKLAAENDVVVLAQASMAHLAPLLNAEGGTPVLASPELCLEALAGLL